MSEVFSFALQQFSNIWHTRTAAIGIVTLGIVATLFAVTSAGASQPTAVGWILVLLVGVGVWNLWFWTNWIPRVPRGKVGILLAVVSDNADHDRQVRADFIDTLKCLLERDPAGTQFSVIVLPSRICKHIGASVSAERILGRLRAHMILFGTVRKRQIKGKEAHILDFHGIVRHAPTTLPASQELSQQFSEVVPRKVILPVESDVFAFEATSQWTDVAARYIIGLAALVSGEIVYAERVLLDVESKIRAGGPNLPALRTVGQKLPLYLGALYSRWFQHLSSRYITTRDDGLLPLLEEVTDKLLSRRPKDVSAWAVKAMCCFLRRRDTDGARRATYKTKVEGDVTWQYNIAFLEAYCGDLGNAEAEYEEAFKGSLGNVTVPVQCEEFIHLILEAEPEKCQLLYCSGLINLFAKEDPTGARNDLERFIGLAGDRFPVQVARAKLLLSPSVLSNRADS